MALLELKKLLKEKTIQFEASLAAGVPYSKLRELYKELKALQFQIIQEELTTEIIS